MVEVAKQKRILIDGLGLVDGHFSGVGQYILGILQGLDQIIAEAKYNNQPVPNIQVIIPRDTVERFKSFNFRHIGYKKFPIPFRYTAALWHRGWLPPIDLWCGRGTYIFPRFVSMPLLFSKSANVIYDLSYELHREFSDEGNAIFLSKMVQKTLLKSKKVITISENSKKEIEEYYKLPAKDVVVATPATDSSVFYRRSQKEIESVKQKYGVKGDYILALSNLEPRKNLDALVDAYCKLPKSITDKTALFLVGVSGWKTDVLFEKIVNRVQEGYNIVRPSSYVIDADKAAIISGAKMLVYPSHYEGFGMPPLEALACGVPVITANNSSLPEVVGKEAKLVDSHNVDELLAAITKYLKNIDQVTSKVRLSGPTQAEQFSWKKSAEVFLKVAKEIE
jgi:alpha-1,3-rhamnosyl/mannosyltransferase